MSNLGFWNSFGHIHAVLSNVQLSGFEAVFLG